MIGTVPVYDAVGFLEKDLKDIKAKDFLDVVYHHAKSGVDFMTIHAGINSRAARVFKECNRITNIVSRGGSVLYAWMQMNNAENPFFEYYDDLLAICKEFDVTLSLGDALRPGCTHDASDGAQIAELIELSLLTKRAWAQDVQVMIEGPGHMAIN
ncbi:phosphomethylpyrimidine synthase ThiC, partial [Campylobacter lari]